MKIIKKVLMVILLSSVFSSAMAVDFICQNTSGCDAEFVTQQGKVLTVHLNSNDTVSTEYGFVINPNNQWVPYR